MRLSSRPAWMLAVLFLGTNLLAAEPLVWETNFERAQQAAAQSNRLVLLHFGTSWCGWCKWMDAEVFSRPEVVKQIQANYVPVKVDAEQNPALAVKYGVDRFPTDVIVTPQGQMVSMTKGKSDAAQYVARLNQSVAIARQPVAASPASIPSSAAMANTNPPAINPPTNNQPINNQPLAAMATNPAVPNPVVAQSAMPAAPVGPSLSLNGPANVASPPANVAPLQLAQPVTMPNPGLANNPPLGNNPPAAYANRNNFDGPMQNPPVASGIMASGAPPMNPPPRIAQANIPPTVGQPQNVPPRNTAQPPQASLPVALDGFCPVSLVEKQQWITGDKRWGAYHQGRTYLFAGPEEQSRFLANGNYERYAPVASGNDIVLAIEERKTVPGMREHGVFFGGHVYLFSSEETLKKFHANTNFYLAQIRGATRQAASPGQQPR